MAAMTELLTQDQTVDTVDVSPSRFDELVAQAEELATLSLDRSMFGPEEVLNLMLDMRAVLLEAQKILAEPAPVG